MSAPEECTFEYGKDGPGAVLVGVDGTANSLNAFSYAVGVARRQRARLVAVYVWPYSGSALDLAGYSSPAIQQGAAETADLVTSLTQQAGDEFGVRVEVDIRRGDACQQLVEAAQQYRADQIVIGASAHFAHRFVGSLAAKIGRHSHTPITVVP